MVSLIYSVIGREKDSRIMPKAQAQREGARKACHRSPPYGRREAKRSGSKLTRTLKHYIMLAMWPKDLFKLMIEILKLLEQRSAEEAIESKGGKKRSSGPKKTEKLPSGYSFFIKFSGKPLRCLHVI